MKDILLVSPDARNESLWVTGELSGEREVRNNYPPLGLATVAALTPRDGYHVRIWDELVHGLITPETELDRAYDLVGVTGYAMHRPRQLELARLFREKGILTMVGGPGVSGTAEAYRGEFDILFQGEVEDTWGQFLQDWEAGAPKPEYHQIGKPELDTSPAPRWDSMANEMKYYEAGAVQTTRGCPYDCEFCDVIYLFGRRQRHKPIEVVIEELRQQARFGYDWIFICDDEFGGDRPYAKALLREMIKLNKSLEKPLYFSTQMCITASGDPEFCELLAQANFDIVFIGIESANPACLKAANKFQNLRGDLTANIHKLLSYGIGIRSGMIVGFDQDGPDVFDLTYEFLQKACMPSVGVYMLIAPVGTRLWMRMMREERVLFVGRNKNLGPARARTNIIPAQLTRIELMQGYHDLLQRIYSWPAFSERIRGFVDLAKDAPIKRGQDVVPPDPEVVVREMGLADEPEGVAAVHEVMEHTARVAPHFMKRARALIIQHAKYRSTLVDLYPAIQRNIQREINGEMILEPYTFFKPLPESFKEDLNKVLPHVHRRMYVHLDRKEDTADALTDVFVEFLMRMGDGFERIEPHHTSLLDELSDRTCAKYNGVQAVHFEPMSEAEIQALTDVPNVKRIRMVDDIFKSVFQRMNEVNKAAAAAS